MADPRSRRTGEHNAEVIKLTTDAVAMRERMDALEGRVLRLEAELSTLRASLAKMAAPVAVSIAPRPTSKRPGALGPPPLPGSAPARPSLQPRKSIPGGAGGGRRSFVDISDTAELIESIPPPPRAPRK